MKIVPEPDALTAPYWRGAARGQLLLQHCSDCGLRWHPPGWLCPRCQSRRFTWAPASGAATVHSYTVVHHAVHGAVAQQVPYVIALFELEEGPRVVANFLGPADVIRIGQAVRLTFRAVAPGVCLPQFEPESMARR